MPIYAYRCQSCDATFEEIVAIGGPAPACPECQGTQVKQMLSRIAAPGKSAQRLREGRAAAAREGHFSNYSATERKSAGV